MLYNCPSCGNYEFGGVNYTQTGERCALCSSPLGLAKGERVALIWNERPTWAVPLPELWLGQQTRQGVVSYRRFVPDESPVIPTGWRYRVAGAWRCSWQLEIEHAGEVLFGSRPLSSHSNAWRVQVQP